MRSSFGSTSDSVITRDGTVLAYEVFGTGPLMVVCHGGPATGYEYLQPELEALNGVARVAFWDYRGSGSSGVAPQETYTFGQLADDLDELRQALGEDRVILLAHSMGGAVALSYALQHPSHCAGLVLIATSPTADPRRLLLGTIRNAGPRRLMRLIGRGVRYLTLWSWRSPSDARTLAQFSIMATLQEGDPRFRDEVRRRESLANNDNAAHLQREAFAFDVVDQLDRIRCPALVMWGRRDAAFAAAAPAYSALPKAEFVALEGVGHHALIEAPEEALGAIRHFIEAVRPRT